MKNFRRSSLFLPLSLLADSFCINLSFIIAFYIRFRNLEALLFQPYELLFWVFNSTWFLLLLIIKPYMEPRASFNIYKLLYKYIILLSIHAALISLYWVFSKGFEYSRMHLLLTYVLAFIFGAIFRTFGLVLLKYLRKYGFNNRNYIIVGLGSLSATIVDFYQKNPAMGYTFKGYFSSTNNSRGNKTLSEIKEFLSSNDIDCLYCCLPYLKNDEISEIISLSELNNVQIKLLMDFRGFSDKGISVEYHNFLPIINVSTSPFRDFKATYIKRIFDLSVSSLIMILGSPIFILVALSTKLSSKGPVFYKSERIGLWGRPFFMFKFRSMYPNESTQKNIVLSSGENDPRITPWGKIMRKTRLDELPQFINVFLGDMSIVGPRPGIPSYNEEVIQIAPEFEKLLTIKPGVTSLGQINYGYAETPEEMVDRMKIDLEYLEKYSLRDDIKLIIQTAQVMLQRKGQ
jgi:exopolysaccharide biosynthesis polyprenyl glycosylphosphotransferase